MANTQHLPLNRWDWQQLTVTYTHTWRGEHCTTCRATWKLHSEGTSFVVTSHGVPPGFYERMGLACLNNFLVGRELKPLRLRTGYNSADPPDRGSSQLGSPSCWVNGQIYLKGSRGLLVRPLRPCQAQKCQENT